MKKHLIQFVLAAAIFGLACNFSFNLATPTPGITPSPTEFAWPSGSGDCTLVTNGDTTVYARPSDESDVFGQVGAGFETVVTGRTANGWAGFDPGVAQAANIGIFRLRWIFFDDATFSGNCTGIPEETWVPDPTACYTMPMESVQVYASPDTSSSVLATVDVEDFAAVLGLTADGWAQVDLGLGNTGATGIGWIDQATLNLNGSACGELPTVTP